MNQKNLAGYIAKSYLKRKFVNRWMEILLFLAGVVALIPLMSVFIYIFSRGWPALNWAFFTSIPQPVGESGGGMANALAGSAILVGISCVVGIPWGIAVGTYLSEYGSGKVAAVTRFVMDILASIPSIVIGLFVYSVLVIPMKRFSALSGGIALGLIMLPTVARTTEELLKLVPNSIREAGLALGLPRWKIISWIVVKGSMRAIMTGVVLAIARVAGETAPLLFTAFGNQFWHRGLDQPIASLPVQIYTYAISPYDEWHQQAWAGALVLLIFVFLINFVTRIALLRTQKVTE